MPCAPTLLFAVVGPQWLPHSHPGAHPPSLPFRSSILPCQDSPGSKFTYSAAVSRCNGSNWSRTALGLVSSNTVCLRAQGCLNAPLPALLLLLQVRVPAELRALMSAVPQEDDVAGLWGGLNKVDRLDW